MAEDWEEEGWSNEEAGEDEGEEGWEEEEW